MEVKLIDKDGEAYVEYQVYLEQYLLNVIKFNSDIETSLAYYLANVVYLWNNIFLGKRTKRT